MSLTGFPLLEKDLALTVRECVLDVESLQTLVKACDLARCRGMCCHDGVFVGKEEQQVISGLLTGEHFVERNGKTKTRTQPAGTGELGEGYPAHFPKTRCTFLDENHHCRLQSRAMDEGHHPWFWKPFPCWLHPLSFQKDRSGRAVLALPTARHDPAAESGYPGFASCTTCGKADEDGRPAWQVLAPELTFLSQISGRDLLAPFAAEFGRSRRW